MATLNPYLSFRDSARAAMDFYQSVFGGEVSRMTFGDMPMPGLTEADAALVMHSQLTTDNGFTLMAADTPAYMELSPGNNFSVSLSGPAADEEQLRGYWEALSEGATITAELNQAPWGDTFGMLTDKFGVGWMVNIAGEQSAG